MDRLGRYKIVAEIGRGGMGTVYCALDPAIGRTVAIKTILFAPNVAPAELQELRDRLLREARTAGTLVHPNIVMIFDAGEDAGIAYIVMEFIQGRTLEQLMAGGGLPLRPERILEILASAARALDYAHGHGIIHRDVKPANIMIQDDGAVKLADFGIAKVMAADTMTAANAMIGSPHFMSPEQLKEQPTTGRSDQFSLAVVAYLLLTGRNPFHGDSMAALLTQIVMVDPPRDVHLNIEADRVLRRALAKDPAKRFDSCAAFVTALQWAWKPRDSLAAAHRRTGRWIAISTALLVLAICGGFGLYYFGSRPPAVQKNAVDGLEYVRIPAGSFTMGCSPGDSECADDEKPAHRVTIAKSFWIGRTETIAGAYKKYAQATANKMPPEPDFLGRALNAVWRNDQMPVVNVTWTEAQSYCNWAGGRLPTEAEWEYTARGGSIAKRYGPLEEVAWYGLPIRHLGKYNDLLKLKGGMHEAGKKKPNGYGLYDVLGNVREWVSDVYSANYDKNAAIDPAGPAEGQAHVSRGGSWYDTDRAVRVSARWKMEAGQRDERVGFRCVCQALPNTSRAGAK